MNENVLCCVTVSLFLLVSTIRCDGEDAGSTSTINKNRRGSSGLISMPRVGRGNIPWTFQDEDVAPGSTVIKSRRGSSGLIPVGRVGRGNVPWTFQISEVEYEKPKRGSSGMIPFPRVGRSELLAHFPIPEGYFEEDNTLVGVPGKRGGENSGETKGMWFGPRLGKRSRRGAEFPWAVVTVKEFPGNRRYGGFTPRLGRESSEIEDEEEGLLEEEETQGDKSDRPTSGLKIHGFN